MMFSFLPFVILYYFLFQNKMYQILNPVKAEYDNCKSPIQKSFDWYEKHIKQELDFFKYCIFFILLTPVGLKWKCNLLGPFVL